MNETVAEILYGKVPPSNKEAELMVISTIISFPKSIEKIYSIINEKMFYNSTYSSLYKVIKNMYEEDESVDIITLSSKLKKTELLDKVGGLSGVMDISTYANSDTNIETHAYIVKQDYIKRELIAISADISTESFKDSSDSLDILSNAELKISGITNQLYNDQIKTKESLLDEIDEDIIKAKEQGYTGYKIDIPEFNDVTTFEKGNLYLFGGRPAMGKTSFVVSGITKPLLEQGLGVFFITLEMPEKQLVRWFLTSYGANYGALKTGNFLGEEYKKYKEAKEKVLNSNLVTYGDEGSNIDAMLNRAKILIQKGEIQVLVIDYLQYVETTHNFNSDTNTKIEFIMAKLKHFAKKYNVPIIVLSQLNREVEKRADRQPQLSDLRSSGSIEQACDVIFFLFRAEYYFEDATYQIEGVPVPAEGILKLICAKNKDGAVKDVYVKTSKDLKHYESYNATSNETVFDYDNRIQSPNTTFDSEDVF